MKCNNRCLKLKGRLDVEECRRLFDGDIDWMLNSTDPLIQELYVKMTTKMLRLRVLVSYIREPYVYAPGNVRVPLEAAWGRAIPHGPGRAPGRVPADEARPLPLGLAGAPPPSRPGWRGPSPLIPASSNPPRDANSNRYQTRLGFTCWAA